MNLTDRRHELDLGPATHMTLAFQEENLNLLGQIAVKDKVHPGLFISALVGSVLKAVDSSQFKMSPTDLEKFSDKSKRIDLELDRERRRLVFMSIYLLEGEIRKASYIGARVNSREMAVLSAAIEIGIEEITSLQENS